MARTPEMMNAKRASDFLGIDRKTLRMWIRAGVGPPRVLKGKRYWFSREELKDWLRNGARGAPVPSAVPPLRLQPLAR